MLYSSDVNGLYLIFHIGITVENITQTFAGNGEDFR